MLQDVRIVVRYSVHDVPFGREEVKADKRDQRADDESHDEQGQSFLVIGQTVVRNRQERLRDHGHVGQV